MCPRMVANHARGSPFRLGLRMEPRRRGFSKPKPHTLKQIAIGEIAIGEIAIGQRGSVEDVQPRRSGSSRRRRLSRRR